MIRNTKSSYIIPLKTFVFCSQIILLCLSNKGFAQSADSLYQKHCSSCHGKELEGGLSEPLTDGIWKFGNTDEAITKSIKNGIKHFDMPAWKGKLTDQQIRSIVILIRENEDKIKSKGMNGAVTKASSIIESKHYKLKLDRLASLPGTIWSISFLNKNKLLATLKHGELYQITEGKAHLIADTPKVWQHGQGGLLDVQPHPNYKTNKWVYLSYAANSNKNKQKGMTVISRGKIVDRKWTSKQIIFETAPHYHLSSGVHFGSRFAFINDYLFFSIGDRGNKEMSQDLSKPNGKIHRLYANGRIPNDNPFISNKSAMPSIWSYGHRNPQGLEFNTSTNQMWSSEHGPRGGDEVNLIVKGQNYGWPKATYGMNYNGTPMNASTHIEGTIQPIHYWVPSIATAGISTYSGNTFAKWKGNLLVGGMVSQALHRLTIKDNQVLFEEVLLPRIGRVRDIAVNEDGKIYLAVNNSNTKEGEILILSVAEK